MQFHLEAMREELAAAPADTDPVAHGVWVLRRASRRPSIGAELELWRAARTDGQLRTALRAVERGAPAELHAVIGAISDPEIAARPRYPIVVGLTVQ